MREGKRLFIFDLLRGVAVFLMILAHCVYFFYDRSNFLLVNIENIGNTFCFTLFLFVAGAVITLAYLQKERSSAESKIKLKKRLLVFLLSYYLLAIFVQMSSIVASSGLDKLKVIFDILTFRLLPSYTEFIPPFAIYSAVVLLFSSSIRKIVEKPLMIFFVAVFLYIFGHVAYSLNVPDFLIPWKAFLVGHPGYYRFPILQYSAVILVGMWWGNIAISKKLYFQKKDLSLNISATLILVLLLVLASNKFTTASYQSIFLRWPPSVGFILIGLAFCFSLTYLFYRSNMLKKARLLRDFLLLLGQNSFALLWAQIVFLQLYSMAGGTKTDSIIIFIFLFLIVLCFSLAIATFIPFNFRIGLTFSKKSLEEEEELLEQEMLFKFGSDLYQNIRQDTSILKNFFLPERTGLRDKRVIKKRHLIGLALIVLLIFNIITPLAKEEIKSKTLSSKAPWWSENYGYYKQISIENKESLSSLKKGEEIKVVFNQQELLDENKALFNGSDIVVVYWDGKHYLNIPYSFSNSKNPEEAEISFILTDEIGPKQILSNYYMYYGNPLAKKIDFSDIKLSRTDLTHEYFASLKKETSYEYVLSPKKKWNLLEKNTTDKVTLLLESSESFDDPKITYNLIDKDISGSFSSVGDNKWEAEIPLNNLASGEYSVQAKIIDGEKVFYSQKSGFFVSYPLYFSWTLDWEGYDAPTKYLDNITRVSNNYSLPITHYFNPRIYIAEDINADRRTFLTDWLKRRLEKNDTLGMHLHMFYDLVTASGIVPKNEPNFGDKGDGYGALTTNYSEEEMGKILTFAKSLFTQNNLPTPIFYRAGGWYANSSTLKSLSNNGFVADSSGRTEDKKTNFKQKGFWNLEANTQPYYPSLFDQNRPSGEEDGIGILEIPDNGADTYWYSALELINRFKQNYDGNFLDSNRAVTFLSHPQWYKDEEMERTNQYLSFIDQYNNKKDYGPIIYSDANTIYDSFKN